MSVKKKNKESNNNEALKPKNTPKNQKKNKKDGGKRKRRRTSSGLIVHSDVMKGTETEFKDFVIDRTETTQKKIDKNVFSEMKENMESVWLKTMQTTLLGDVQVPSVSEKRSRFKKLCYNCGGEHNLSDCVVKKDMKRIQQSKKTIIDDIRRRQSFYKRYTNEEAEFVPKYKAGEISNRLRNALGIGKNEIPEYIYRMRRMGFVKGYPPGYSKRAIQGKEQEKILKIYEISTPNQNTKEDNRIAKVDKSKLIKYCGFNHSHAKLIDREQFDIPPFNTFCKLYSNEVHKNLKKMHAIEKKKLQKEGNASETENDVIIIEEDEKKKENCDDDDIIILDNDDDLKTPKRKAPSMDDVEEGDSICYSYGTPVVPKKKQQLSSVPSLDAFSVGILPFEAREECTEGKGTFKRLMSKLRK